MSNDLNWSPSASAASRRETLKRRHFIGGSDARIIMGNDEKALKQLWLQKRGEAEDPDLSGVLIVQLGLVTEDLNRLWYERNSGHQVTAVQKHVVHRTIPWMAFASSRLLADPQAAATDPLKVAQKL
jgi:predicted phage-related endonuclease